jgi:hypothetical protein
LTEMLETRFEQIEIVCETETSTPITPSNPHFAAYTAACERTRQLNSPLLARQHEACLDRGWLPVPLDPDSGTTREFADGFGSLLAAASIAMSRLVHSDHAVWAVIRGGNIAHVAPRSPGRELPELEYQVWRADALDQLSRLSGDIVEGELLAMETGLWFRRSNETDTALADKS